MKRRNWIQKSLISSSAVLFTPYIASKLNESKRANEYLRLHWNENPFGPSEKVIKAVQAAVPMANLYWDEKNDELREKLASLHNLSSDQYLMTSGSTEILTLLGQHVGLQEGEIVMCDQSFPTIGIFGSRCGARIKKVPMNNYKLDLDQLLSAISSKTTLVFICNPNNPTSTEISKEKLESFCRAVPDNVLICVDEAYIEFSKNGVGGSLVGLINELPNLIITRTFSKVYGMAGFRLGYAISQPHNIKALSLRYPALGMAPGLLPFVAGISALDDHRFVSHVVNEVNEGKRIMIEAFKQWNVIHAESSTNFLYVNKKKFVKDVKERLAVEKIWIAQWPSMKDHIRISIGKSDWMTTLVNKMEGLRV
ncbi:MAG: histidinol-phosphate transaminase [Saprospiraceae bacterium]